MAATAAVRARLTATVSAVTLLAVAVPAWAQEAGSDQEARLEEVIVTAQKREQRIQDVPIAISAFNEEALQAQRIEGGVDLVRAIPNVAFTKTNFNSYNFQIRGLGTQAVSATSDPGVAVAFNSTGIIQNRLFEQEYFDIQRVEVLRGPQGTLYGRNATAGVVNVIPRGADLNDFEGLIRAEIGNYDTRRMVGTLNLPLAEGVLALRIAGAATQRDGFDYNSVTGNNVNGRNLWGTRATLAFEPTDRFRSSLIWEHFEEDDNRSRTGKQLCHRDTPPEMIGSTTVIDGADLFSTLGRPAMFSTGCKAGSLYDDGAFGTPNGASIPFVLSSWTSSGSFPWGYVYNPALGGPDDISAYESFGGLLQLRDPYGGLEQSHDLREIASFRDPIYRAQADIFQLNVEFDLSDALTLNSQTLYVEDSVYSFQDVNRFNTLPFFNDTSLMSDHPLFGPSAYRDLAPGGVFCDPQIGCSNTMAGFDISRADAEQFTQEFRLSSSFDGPVNFSVGANHTRYETLSQYYVMNNVLTALAMTLPFNGSGDFAVCSMDGWGSNNPVPMEDAVHCPYIDPNPAESINGDGHNYFRSINPYELTSTAAFGELYWDIGETLRVTAGLRYTDDRKSFDIYPTQLLLAPNILAGGIVGRGYPKRDTIELEWGEWTGRLGVDWKPDLSFTDDTLLYAFYSRGYKGGGMNPPLPDFATGEEYLEAGYITQAMYDAFVATGFFPILSLIGKEYEQTFEPEYVNAFEVGAKNTLLDGAMIFNATAFFYDYTDYQVSQVRNRSAINENYDATVWGLEFETRWEVAENFRLNANLGFLKTRIADGEGSIDIMNRNLGDPNYTVARAWAQIPSNCVVPTAVAESHLNDPGFSGIQAYWRLCGGYGALGSIYPGPTDPATGLEYDPANYPELNGGSGLTTDLSGKELPNAPNWTFNLGAEYDWHIGEAWMVTVRGDYYRQGESWHRVYNLDPYDRLQGWDYVNLGIWAESADGLRIEAYVKNVFDSTPITGAFLNSDDQGLTTNIFTLDPRLFAFSISQRF
jgi:outer membrane receptor protein involved in Fe transport